MFKTFFSLLITLTSATILAQAQTTTKQSASKLSFKEVTVGITDQRNFTEIVAGLDGSEQIAVAPPLEIAKFKEGMKVHASL